MRLMAEPAAEMWARVEEQTKGYREVSERFGRTIQSALNLDAQISEAVPKIDTPALLPEMDFGFGLNKHLERMKPIEPPRSLTRHLEEMQERLAAEAAERELQEGEWEREQDELAAEWEADRQRREELDAARHDAMLSALNQGATYMAQGAVHMAVTAELVGDLLDEQRSAHAIQVATFLLAYLGVVTAVLVPAWGALDWVWRAAAGGGVVLGVVSILIATRRRS